MSEGTETPVETRAQTTTERNCTSYSNADPGIEEFTNDYSEFMATYYADSSSGTASDSGDDARRMFEESPGGNRPSVKSVFVAIPQGGAVEHSRWTCTIISGSEGGAVPTSGSVEKENPALRLYAGLLTCVDVIEDGGVAELPQSTKTTIDMLCPQALPQGR